MRECSCGRRALICSILPGVLSGKGIPSCNISPHTPAVRVPAHAKGVQITIRRPTNPDFRKRPARAIEAPSTDHLESGCSFGDQFGAGRWSFGGINNRRVEREVGLVGVAAHSIGMQRAACCRARSHFTCRTVAAPKAVRADGLEWRYGHAWSPAAAFLWVTRRRSLDASMHTLCCDSIRIINIMRYMSKNSYDQGSTT